MFDVKQWLSFLEEIAKRKVYVDQVFAKVDTLKTRISYAKQTGDFNATDEVEFRIYKGTIINIISQVLWNKLGSPASIEQVVLDYNSVVENVLDVMSNDMPDFEEMM